LPLSSRYAPTPEGVNPSLSSWTCRLQTQVDFLGVAVGLEGFGNTQNGLCGVAVSKSQCGVSMVYIHPKQLLAYSVGSR